jgi:ectoine hydroxylase-related dioxygenase (phytanoyl-CoA dioxygenase family)
MATSLTTRIVTSRPVYRLLYKRLNLPRTRVHALLSWARGRDLADQLSRRAELLSQLAPAPDAIALNESEARVVFAPGDVPGAVEVAARCREIYAEFQANGVATETLQRNPNKRFLLSVLSGNEFLAYPELVRFMVSHPILDAAARYLGTMPRLEGAALWWTPPNDTVTSSQMVHIDELAPRQVKMILNCDTVDADNGPLHVLPADRSAELLAMRGRRGRIDDDWMASTGALAEMQPVMGPPGSGVVFDSSRCLHYGSRRNVKDRLALAFHFMPIDAPVDSRYHIEANAIPESLADLDPYQRLALGTDTR